MNPESDPIITTVGGRSIVGHVAETRVVMRYRRVTDKATKPLPLPLPSLSTTTKSSSSESKSHIIVTGSIPADQLYDEVVDSSIKGGLNGTNSGLVVPILGGTIHDTNRKLIGVCQVINRFDGNFSDDDVETLEKFVIFARDEVLQKENQG